MTVSAFTRMRCFILTLALISLSACAAAAAGGDTSVPAPPASVPAAAETAALPYTADYLLFSSSIDENEYPVYGLADKDKNVLLPAKYREISVSESGLIFTSFQDGDKPVAQVFGGDGSQIGPNYSWIECVWTDSYGNPGTYSASTAGQRPAPPYTARASGDSKDRCWILDENGRPKDAEPYEDIMLWPDGAIYACRDGIRFIFKRGRNGRDDRKRN